MERPRLLVFAGALAFGAVAVWYGGPELRMLDAVTGFLLVGLGFAAGVRRPGSGTGLILAAVGAAWFAGSLASWALYLHRGVLGHLVVAYPDGKLTSSRDRIAVAAAYAYGAAYPVSGNAYATIAFALGLVALSGHRYLAARGIRRRRRLAPLAGAVALASVMLLAAADRLFELSSGLGVLWAYEIVVCLVGAGLVADLLWGRWTAAAVTGVVVDLGEPVEAVALRDRLARLVGDPTLSLLYWLPEEGRYVDEAGRTAEPPAPDAGRAVMAITEGSAPVALLAHDPAVLEDERLARAVASATRLAVSNSLLRAQLRARVAEVEASRRRIVEAADEQRRLLGSELREGPERRLDYVAELVCDLDAELSGALAAARSALRDLARGIHPATLTEHGLGPALGELAAGCPIPVDLRVGPDRLPSPIEAVAYFVCSEALTNAAKHAKASRVAIRVSAGDERLTIEVTDDGVGGADPSGGTGLRGLMDRVEALGGGLELDKPAKGWTRLRADIPLTWHRARG